MQQKDKLSAVVVDRRVDRLPMALHEGTGRVLDVVALDGHGVRPSGLRDRLQRIVQVCDPVREGLVRIVREDLEQ